ncbi:MAG: hypothetical protein K2F57_00030 [Candidatus Gastranaerophilales bacterium]|nr:hypothetical protein [Candidatus Gastranaerophilales bacterium]
MQIRYNPHPVMKQPKKALLSLEENVTKILQNKGPVNPTIFSSELHSIGDAFVKRNELECLNKHSKRMAENLVKLGDLNLAGIVYSLLIRLNPKNTTIVEQAATNALAIAKRFNDPIHIMARANDLKEIYKISQPGSSKHLKALQTEKKALNEICNNYEGVKKRYRTLSRKMRPVEAYELKLAAIRFEIAEIIAKENKTAAIEELLAAKTILEKSDQGKLYNKIINLLAELKK